MLYGILKKGKDEFMDIENIIDAIRMNRVRMNDGSSGGKGVNPDAV
jgi:hypothetical protein